MWVAVQQIFASSLHQVKATMHSYAIALGVDKKQKTVKKCSIIQDVVCCNYWGMISHELHKPTGHVDKCRHQI